MDVQSTLADAAEEISMAYSEKVEDKELAERKVEAEPPFQVMSAEEIAAYLADSHAGDQAEKLASIVARMLSGHEAPKNAASRFSGDVTQQFVVVQHALREGQSNGTDASILEMLQEVIAEMAMEHGPAIQAGLNTCRAAGEYASDRPGFERFQQTYRDVVLGDASLAGTLKTLLERLDNRDGPAFARGLQAMLRALGDDLSAQRPSADHARLQALVSDLYHLEVTATVLEHCNELCATLDARQAS